MVREQTAWAVNGVNGPRQSRRDGLMDGYRAGGAVMWGTSLKAFPLPSFFLVSFSPIEVLGGLD